MLNDPVVELEKQLGGRPAVEVLGVVQANGASGAKTGQAEHWNLTITFEAWRQPPGNVQTRRLTLRQRVSQDRLRAAMKQIQPFSVVRVRARLPDSASGGGLSQGLLMEFVGPFSADPELNGISHRLRQPVTFEDPRFGTFTLDRRIDWFEAKVAWISAPIRLTIHNGSPEELKSAFELAYALWDAKKSWDQSMAEYAAKELLDLLNDNWLPEGESKLSAKQFEAKIRLESIDIQENGKFDFWYDDANLFGGHAIRVEGSLENGPEDAGIEG